MSEAEPDAAASDDGPEDVDEAEAEQVATTWDELDLPTRIRSTVDSVGWTAPTPVQARCYTNMVAGTDILVQSQTGSGKTGAFCLPWLASRFEIGPADYTGVQLLVLLPTRELAKQVCDELVRLAVDTPVDVLPVYGGTAMAPQLDALADGVHAVVGTPGRILDHIRRRSLDLSKVRTVVLDECDEMLSMGFLEDIRAILSACPRERQTCLFSATVPRDIDRIARRNMRDPVRIELSGDEIAAAEIDHAFYSTMGTIKTRDLLDVIILEDPTVAIVFCNTREETRLVANVLQKNGYSAHALSSDLTQAAREKVMAKFRDRKLRFLVATDVAARGIDVSHISHVINYSFPENAEVYVHRTGRTGRAGRPGQALSIVSPLEIGSFYTLKKSYKSIQFTERKLPPKDELAATRTEVKLDRISHDFSEPVSPEWLLLARRLSEDPRGERVVAYLLHQAIEGQRARAEAEAPDEAPEDEGLDELRESVRERGRGRGRDRDRRPRESDRGRDRERSRGRERGRGRDGGRDGGRDRERERERDDRSRDDDRRHARKHDDDDGRRRGRSRKRSDESGDEREHEPKTAPEPSEAAKPPEAAPSEETATPPAATEASEAATPPASDEPAATEVDTPEATASERPSDEASADAESPEEPKPKRRRRRRRRRRSTSNEGDDERDDKQDADSDDSDDKDDSDDAPGDDAPGEEGARPKRKRRRRRRRGKSGSGDGPAQPERSARRTKRRRRSSERQPDQEPASEAESQTPRVSQDEIVIDIDETELSAVRDEFGEIDELDELTLKGRRRAVLDDITDEVEVEDLTDRDAEDDDDSDAEDDDDSDAEDDDDSDAEDDDDDSDDDKAPDAADDDDDGDSESATSEAREPASEAGPDSASATDADDEPKKKRRRRRRRRRKQAAPPPPELTCPPHKDFWEVWANKFSAADFEREDDNSEDESTSDAEGHDTVVAHTSEAEEPTSDVPLLSDPPDEDSLVRVDLNIGRRHGHKAAHVRSLLRRVTGLHGKAVKDLTVRDQNTLFRMDVRHFETVVSRLDGSVVEDVSLTLVHVDETEAAPLRLPDDQAAATVAAAEATADSLEPAPSTAAEDNPDDAEPSPESQDESQDVDATTSDDATGDTGDDADGDDAQTPDEPTPDEPTQD